MSKKKVIFFFWESHKTPNEKNVKPALIHEALCHPLLTSSRICDLQSACLTDFCKKVHSLKLVVTEKSTGVSWPVSVFTTGLSNTETYNCSFNTAYTQTVDPRGGRGGLLHRNIIFYMKIGIVFIYVLNFQVTQNHFSALITDQS